MRFLASELKEIFLSILVLMVAVSGLSLHRLVVVAIPLLLGFFLHEISHKWAASRFGFFSVYRSWPLGLTLALVLGLVSRGRFLFAAPGAVVILAGFFTPEQAGRISLAGPLANVFLACCFLPLSTLPGWLGEMAMQGIFLNLWLATFNLLPVPPLDGSKVFNWNPPLWAALEIPLLALSFLF
ncbi:MAG: site-2 protease family protein [Candidatus Hadarchaeales archaeon]